MAEEAEDGADGPNGPQERTRNGPAAGPGVGLRTPGSRSAHRKVAPRWAPTASASSRRGHNPSRSRAQVFPRKYPSLSCSSPLARPRHRQGAVTTCLGRRAGRLVGPALGPPLGSHEPRAGGLKEAPVGWPDACACLGRAWSAPPLGSDCRSREEPVSLGINLHWKGTVLRSEVRGVRGVLFFPLSKEQLSLLVLQTTSSRCTRPA